MEGHIPVFGEWRRKNASNDESARVAQEFSMARARKNLSRRLSPTRVRVIPDDCGNFSNFFFCGHQENQIQRERHHRRENDILDIVSNDDTFTKVSLEFSNLRDRKNKRLLPRVIPGDFTIPSATNFCDGHQQKQLQRRCRLQENGIIPTQTMSDEHPVHPSLPLPPKMSFMCIPNCGPPKPPRAKSRRSAPVSSPSSGISRFMKGSPSSGISRFMKGMKRRLLDTINCCTATALDC